MGNVYMEADQVRFKSSTYRNVQEGLAAALEGGGGGGTAADVSYDNTDSGLTAETVQAAIDEVVTDLGSLSTIIGDSSAGLVKEVTDIEDLIPSGATSENKLATEDDIPDNTYSTTEVKVGKWGSVDLYRKIVNVAALPNNASADVTLGISGYTLRRLEVYYGNASEAGNLFSYLADMFYTRSTDKLTVQTNTDMSIYAGTIIVEYTKE